MRIPVTIVLVLAALLLAGCGGTDEPQKDKEPMKVEDTAFGPLVGTPKKVEDRVDAAAEQYREGMDKRLEDDEGGTAQEPAED